MNVKQFDALDKRIYTYMEKTGRSEVNTDKMLTKLTRKHNINMYQAMSILEENVAIGRQAGVA